VPLYGFDRWSKLFAPCQLLALDTFVKHVRAVRSEMNRAEIPKVWRQAISALLCSGKTSTVC